MSVSLVDSLKDDKNIHQVAQETKYIRQDMVADSEGNTLYTKQYEITENEAENYEEPLQPQSSYSEYSTSVKKICIKIYSTSGSEKVVQLTNSWITIPKTKSYDVIALMPGNTSLTDNIDSSSISGYMEYNDGQIVNYSSGSKNIKKSTGLFSGQGGVGISMNIPDTTYKNLKNSMMVKFLSGASPFKVYGTYQHAKSSVSLSESQNYSFSSQGLGGVLKFNKDSIKNKYDGMTGVRVVYHEGDEFDEY